MPTPVRPVQATDYDMIQYDTIEEFIMRSGYLIKVHITTATQNGPKTD